MAQTRVPPYVYCWTGWSLLARKMADLAHEHMKTRTRCTCELPGLLYLSYSVPVGYCIARNKDRNTCDSNFQFFKERRNDGLYSSGTEIARANNAFIIKSFQAIASICTNHRVTDTLDELLHGISRWWDGEEVIYNPSCIVDLWVFETAEKEVNTNAGH